MTSRARENARRGARRRHTPRFDTLETRIALAAVVGTLLEDLQGDGSGDVPRPSAGVFLDLNGNGVRDAFTRTWRTSASMRITAGRTATSQFVVDLPSGASITRIEVHLKVDADKPAGEFWYSDEAANRPILLTAPGGGNGQVPLAEYMSGDLDLTFDDLDPAASDGLTRQRTPVLGAPAGGVWLGSFLTRYSREPQGPRNLTNDLAGRDPSGTWTLELHLDKSDATLNSWSIEITSLEPLAVTDSRGRYTFSAVGPGTYAVRPVPEATWRMTSGAGTVVVTAASPPTVAAPGLTVHQQKIRGAVVEDVDGDGRGDRPALAGFPVFVDLDRDGLLDPGEPLAATGLDGRYVVRGVAPGTYSIVVDPGTTWEPLGRPEVTIPSDGRDVDVPEVVYRRRTTFDVTPVEQYYLEQVNRLRRDARGFLLGEVRATETFSFFFPDADARNRYSQEIATMRPGPLPPIAWEPRLRNLSDEMVVMMRDLKARRFALFAQYFPSRFRLDSEADMDLLRGRGLDEAEYVERLSQRGIVPDVRPVAAGESPEYGPFTFVATHPEFQGGYDEPSRTLRGIVGPGATAQQARDHFYRELRRWASALNDPNGLASGHNVPGGRYGDAYSERAGRAGYGAGEGNSLSRSPYHALIDLLVDGGSPGIPLDDADPLVRGIRTPGHRAPYVDPRVREIGIGLATNTDQRLAGEPRDGFDPSNANPIYFSGNIGEGRPDRAYVLGVAYRDLDGDGRYDIGEQLADVEVSLVISHRWFDGRFVFAGSQATRTWSGGGYQFEIQTPMFVSQVPYLFVNVSFGVPGANTTRSELVQFDPASGRFENVKIDLALPAVEVRSPSTTPELDAIATALASARGRVEAAFGDASGPGAVAAVNRALSRLGREVDAGLASDPGLRRLAGPKIRALLAGRGPGNLRGALIPAARAFSAAGRAPASATLRPILADAARGAFDGALLGVGAAGGLYYFLTNADGAGLKDPQDHALDPRAVRRLSRRLSAEIDAATLAVWRSVRDGLAPGAATPGGVRRSLTDRVDRLHALVVANLSGVPGFSEDLQFHLAEPVLPILGGSLRDRLDAIPDANPYAGSLGLAARSLYAEQARSALLSYRAQVLGLLSLAGEYLAPAPAPRR